MAPHGALLPYLRAWREWRGLSQRELARLAKTGVATISRIENGGVARFETLGDLAKALKVTREQLLREEPGKVGEKLHGAA